MKDRQLLIAASVALYGQRGRPQLAAKIGYAPSTLQLWVNGTKPVPLAVRVAIVKALNERKKEIAFLEEQISKEWKL